MSRNIVSAEKRRLPRHFQWNPDVEVEQSESLGHDGNQCSGLAIQGENASYEPRVSVELALPHPVAHGEHRLRGGIAVCRSHWTAEERPDAQEIEGIRG